MRPYVRRLDPDTLSWQPIFKTGVQRKVYNTDPEDQSFTSIAQVPKGWVGPSGAHYHTSFEEAYILEGSLTLDGTDYLLPRSYLYRPGMIVHGWTELSEESALIIIKRGGVSDIVPVGEPLKSFEYPFKEVHDGRPHIVHLKTEEMEWTAHGEGAGHYKVKVLSEDQDNGDSTSLILLPPGWQGEIKRSSGRDLECILVEGAAELGDGTPIRRLHYLYRPPSNSRVPIVSSKGGCLALVWEATPR